MLDEFEYQYFFRMEVFFYILISSLIFPHLTDGTLTFVEVTGLRKAGFGLGWKQGLVLGIDSIVGHFSRLQLVFTF
jgi:hypothetical protein